MRRWPMITDRAIAQEMGDDVIRSAQSCCIAPDTTSGWFAWIGILWVISVIRSFRDKLTSFRDWPVPLVLASLATRTKTALSQQARPSASVENHLPSVDSCSLSNSLVSQWVFRSRWITAVGCLRAYLKPSAWTAATM